MYQLLKNIIDPLIFSFIVFSIGIFLLNRYKHELKILFIKNLLITGFDGIKSDTEL